MQFIWMELKIPFDWHFELKENENIYFAMSVILKYTGCG